MTTLATRRAGRSGSAPHARLRPALGLLVATALLSGCSDGPTAVAPEGTVDLALPWRVSTPEAVGMDGSALFVAGELAARVERIRSLVVVRSGRLAYERYYGGWTADTLADVRSVTKSVVSTLVGIAIEEGHVEGLAQPITDFLEGPRFAVRPEHGAITVGHLLTMSGGFAWREIGPEYNDWLASADHVEYLLARSLAATPGAAFTYNSAAIHLLGVLLEEATGVSLPEYADRVLFGPIGIRARRWEDLGTGYVNGGAGLDLRPRDLARFGQLFLQEGWSGRAPVVPQSWVRDATAPAFGAFTRVGSIDSLSYGYLWWIDLEHDAFFAWGFAGQFVYVAPALELVVVATTDWRDVSGDIGNERLQEEVLAVIVERILPAVS